MGVLLETWAGWTSAYRTTPLYNVVSIATGSIFSCNAAKNNHIVCRADVGWVKQEKKTTDKTQFCGFVTKKQYSRVLNNLKTK